MHLNQASSDIFGARSVAEGESAGIQKDPESLGYARDDTKRQHGKPHPFSHALRAEEYHRRVKTNPFPWFPWWPKVEESHYVPIIVIALVLAAVLIYFSGI
jgi:hypothetical protein